MYDSRRLNFTYGLVLGHLTLITCDDGTPNNFTYVCDAAALNLRVCDAGPLNTWQYYLYACGAEELDNYKCVHLIKNLTT